MQRQLANGFLAEAKKLIKEGNTKDGGFQFIESPQKLYPKTRP